MSAHLTRDAVASQVIECLAAVLEIDASAISESQTFKDDLGADSIALVEFVFDMEERFSALVGNFSVNDEDLEHLKTVGQTVDYVFNAVTA